MPNDVTISTAVNTANPHATDLYEILGVDKTADAATIRHAYRTASMLHHPDRNDGSEASHKLFQIIKEAYETLIDPKLREFYDNTGVRKPTDDQIEAKAHEMVNGTFQQVFDLIGNNPDPTFNVEYHDPVVVVLDSIRNSLKGIHKARADMKTAALRFENLLKRFKKKQGEFALSPLGNVLTEKIKHAKRFESASQLDITVHERALILALDYSCVAEVKPMTNMFTSTVFYTRST